MKIQSPAILSFLITILLSSCINLANKSPYGTQTPININDISSIEILKRTENNDSIKGTSITYTKKRLSNDQVKTFTDKWNKANTVGPVICLFNYKIDVTLLDSTKRHFRVCQNYIKENNDWAFDVGDKNLIEHLWSETK